MSNLTIGKIANNSVTLVLSSEQRSEVNRAELLNVSAGFVNVNLHTRFWVTVPNSMGFTHKTRCLCHVESVSGTVEIRDPALQVSALGVRIGGMNPQRIFRNGADVQDVGEVYLSHNQVHTLEPRRAQVGALLTAFGPAAATEAGEIKYGSEVAGPVETTATFVGQGDVVSSGVLCATPFGKRLEVEVFDLVSRKPLIARVLAGAAEFVNTHQATPLADNNVTIKLRLLFLDENDLKDY